MSKYGPIPDFEWLDIRLLTIDRSYQRMITGESSQKNIKKIAREFRWGNFQPITVNKRGDKYYVTDGQHRLMAAIECRDIQKVPCWIKASADAKEEAQSFVAINRNRVRMDTMSVFYAGVIAGDEMDCKVFNLCARAGVTICRTGSPTDLMPPRHTKALGSIRSAIGVASDAAIVRGLKALADAFPETKGQMRASMVRAIIHLYNTNLAAKKQIDDARMADIINGNDPIDLERNARDNKDNFNNSPWLGIVAELTAQYNNRLPASSKLEPVKLK